MLSIHRLFLLIVSSEEDCRADLLDTHLNEMFPGCLKTYSSDSEDRTPYHLPQWIPLNNLSHFSSVNDICPKPWRYQSSSKINTLSHEAVTETYDGGGYVADLGYNRKSAAEVVRDLRQHNWVDERTAAVFIEFTLFDPSSSLFCNVRNIYERLATGQVVTKVDVRVLSLYPSMDGNMLSFYEVCQLLFLIVIVVFFIVEIVKYFRQKKYLFQVWNWIQLILLTVSFVAVVMSFLKGKQTSLYVQDIQTNPYDTFSSDSIARLLGMETFWLSMAIFIITLKLLRLIRFNPHICQMQETLRRSAQPILSFSLVMAIAILAFSQFGFLCFGVKLVSFSSFFKALRVVLLMSVGKSINNVEVHLKYPFLGPLFLFFFLLVILFVLINVFVAVLVDSYAEIREEQGDGGFVDAEVGTYMYSFFLKKIKEFPGKFNFGRKFLQNPSPYRLKSLQDESLDNIDYEIFEPLKNIKDFHLQPLCSQQCCNDDNVRDPANIKESVKEDQLSSNEKLCFIDKSSEPDASYHEKKVVTLPRCPQECFDDNRSCSAVDDNEICKEDELLTYIKIHFMEIITELSLISSSKGRKVKK